MSTDNARAETHAWETTRCACGHTLDPHDLGLTLTERIETYAVHVAEARRMAAGRAETTAATTEDIHALDARWFERWETEQPLADKYAGYYQGRVSAVAQCREELRGLLATARTVNVHPNYTVEYQQKIADELGVEREAVLRALGLAAPLLNHDQPTEAEAGARVVEDTAHILRRMELNGMHLTDMDISGWLHERAARIRGGDDRG